MFSVADSGGGQYVAEVPLKGSSATKSPDAPEWSQEDGMKQRHHTLEQVIRKLAEGDKLLNEGKDLPEVCRHLEIAESTWHRWKAQYGGMKANDAKRLKELENENNRLKRIVADLTLDNAMLKEVAKGNF
jgi:cell division protein FtsB